MSKTGLIVEGGGMKCAYSAGVLDAFHDMDITFDYVIGVSAGAANAMSFVAQQKGRNRRFYVEHIKEPMYFGVKSFLKTGNLFNLEYIYGTITNSDGSDPIDYDAVMASPAEYELVATNARTGKATYFSKYDLEKDHYLHIMASSAIPAVSKPVKIGNEYYYDGGISDSIPVQRALDQGCDKLVVITSKPRNFVKTPEKHRTLYSLLCRRYPKAVEAMDNRYLMYNRELKQMYELEKEGRCFIFAPSESMKMSTYAMDEVANQKLYDLGLKDYQDLEKSFLDFMNKT